MQGFRSWPALQRYVQTFSAVRNLFVPLCLRRSALTIDLHRLEAIAGWKSAAALAA